MDGRDGRLSDRKKGRGMAMWIGFVGDHSKLSPPQKCPVLWSLKLTLGDFYFPDQTCNARSMIIRFRMFFFFFFSRSFPAKFCKTILNRLAASITSWCKNPFKCWVCLTPKRWGKCHSGVAGATPDRWGLIVACTPNFPGHNYWNVDPPMWIIFIFIFFKFKIRNCCHSIAEFWQDCIVKTTMGLSQHDFSQSKGWSTAFLQRKVMMIIFNIKVWLSKEAFVLLRHMCVV